jgi:hypothetical protein
MKVKIQDIYKTNNKNYCFVGKNAFYEARGVIAICILYDVSLFLYEQIIDVGHSQLVLGQ